MTLADLIMRIAEDNLPFLFNCVKFCVDLATASAVFLHMAKIFGLFSIPDPLKSAASPSELKKRLDWGEPALTIIDIRSRKSFNESHITGAASIPNAVLVETLSTSLELERDIYVYGSDDEQSSEAAHRLREAGYQSVAELKGGLPAWKAIKGAVETSGVAAA